MNESKVLDWFSRELRVAKSDLVHAIRCDECYLDNEGYLVECIQLEKRKHPDRFDPATGKKWVYYGPRTQFEQMQADLINQMMTNLLENERRLSTYFSQPIVGKTITFPIANDASIMKEND